MDNLGAEAVDTRDGSSRQHSFVAEVVLIQVGQ